MRLAYWMLVLVLAVVPGGALIAQDISYEDYVRLQQTIARQEARLQHLESTAEPMRLPDPTFSNASHTGAPHLNASHAALLESRVAELEARLAEDEEEDRCVPALAKPTQKWTGRVHFDYWGFPKDDPLPNFLETGDPNMAPEDFIGFRRLRFGVAGDITDTMRYKIEMEWAVPEDPAMKDAYLGWDELPYLHTVLLGNQKRPYGLDTLNSSRYNVFMERPFHVEAFNQDARRIGLQSYGVSENERWNWRYGYFIMDDLQKAGGQYSDNYQSEVAGRLANTIWYDECSDGRGYAHWAVSGAWAFPGNGPDGRFLTRPEARTQEKWYDTGDIDGAKRYTLIGFEGVVNVGALQIVGEYQKAEVDRTALPNLDFDGWYVYAAYFLTGEHTPWERDSGTIGRVKPFENFFLVNRCCGGHAGGLGAWQVAVRYSTADFTDQEIFGGVGESVTFGMNWWWTPYSRVQFNYINGRISQRAADGGAPLAPGLPTAGNYDMFGVRWMCDF